tara:strand:- start:480 stop:734 length:255 start_codon:yes stop_codon:yes gene_type:complete
MHGYRISADTVIPSAEGVADTARGRNNDMSGWQTLWTWTLGLSVVLFFVVEVVVVVGGVGDIKDMLSSLRQHAADKEDESKHEE